MTTIKHLLLISTLPNVISTLHILFYILLLGKSHIDFTDSLIDSLVENGHTVDLIIARMNSHVTTNGSSKASRIYSYGFQEESPWSKTPHLLDPFQPRVRTWMEHEHYMGVATDLCEIGLGDPGLHAFLANQMYDIGIATEYDYCGLALMKYYSIPSTVSVSSLAVLDQQSINAGMPNSAAVTQAIFETEDLTTWFGKLKNLINWTHINWIVHPYCREVQFKSIRKFFGSNFELSSLVESIDVQFVNSNELIDLPRVGTPKMKYIGGINLKKSIKKLEKSIEEVIGDVKEGIVVFCFGTQVPSNLFPIEVRKSFAGAFRQFPEFTFVWKYELQDGDEQLFQNITNLKFLKWLPQTDLLNDHRTKAFISHVGLNSYLESSYAGIPILAIPLFADQPHNAHSGESIGTTYVLDKTDLTTENIIKGLKAVLHDPSYLQNAKRISKMLHERPNPPKSIFVEWVEYAARNPLLHRNLNLPSQKMTVIQYYCIDILAGCVVFVVFVVFVVWKMLKLVLERISRRANVKKLKKIQ
ncbi:Protein CBR-UGT-52 [Caenorhabditis briggsae]|uniref:glucuronosyltransferase n=1 Tax=Caenorhabditis briggsae TaxID=6238 RepID=A8WJJ8_CAEBR|nr:Protein CBR-UGT-52 [Caenorhabditis briggsae]CAP20641.1 Protein CBR-UGT-52 [Caenorhabditis briggsae]